MSNTATKPIYQPNPDFAKHARIINMDEYKALCKKVEEDYEGFWEQRGLLCVPSCTHTRTQLAPDLCGSPAWFRARGNRC